MRSTRSSAALLACIVFWSMPAAAQAGMAMPTFTDMARARLEVLSFFFVSYLVLAFIYQRIWNSLARDFPKLPRLSYRGALGALVVCGLFIYVVLTMISGARELLTPGAWARSGVLYKIREPERDPKPWIDTARRASLERLRNELWRFAEQHDGRFPTSREWQEMPATFRESIDPNGLSIVYLAGSKPDAGKDVLAYEPGSFGAKRMVLLSSGDVAEMNMEELMARVRNQIRAPIETTTQSPPP